MPTILENSIDGFINQINKLIPYFDYFQIDIADGKFVPNKTVSLEEITNLFSKNFKLKTSNCFDFHLMVEDYEKEIKEIIKLEKYVNIKNILVHSNAEYQIINTKYPQLTFGLVINPSETIKTIIPNNKLNDLPAIQIMSVEPGFQGSPFIKETLNKVEQLRLANYRNKILIDGGVNKNTIPLIMDNKYRPDIMCVGSFITKCDDLADRVSYLKSLG